MEISQSGGPFATTTSTQVADLDVPPVISDAPTRRTRPVGVSALLCLRRSTAVPGPASLVV